MAELTLDLKKDTGGCTLTHDGEEYHWEKAGDVVTVPYEWGLELLAVKGGGFSEADEKAAEKAHEKAAADAATVAPDEPPRDAPVHDEGLAARAPEGLDLPVAQEQLPPRPVVAAPESGDGSKITPRPRGGTRSPAKK